MRKIIPFLLTLILVALPGCRQTPPAATRTGEPSPTLAVATPTSTSLPSRVLLYALESGWDEEMIQRTAVELANQAGWVLEQKTSFDPADLTADVVMVIFLGLPAESGLLAGKPETHFILITHADVDEADNISILAGEPADLAFLAGFIAEITAEDWRAGALIGNDGPFSAEESVAFRNGGWYLCGLCNPKYPPYPGFPTVEQYSINSDWTDWQAGADALIANRVKVAYLSPEASSVEVSGYLARMGVYLIGQGQPPAETSGKWITSLRWSVDEALRNEWLRLVAGESGRKVSIPLALENTDGNLLTGGKQRLVGEVMVLLQSGMIEPLSVP